MTLVSAMDSFPKEQMHELTQIVENSMAKSKLILLSLTNQQKIGAMGYSLKDYECWK